MALTKLPCRTPGCAALVPPPGGHCEQHTKSNDSQYRKRRRESGVKHLYGLAEWRRERVGYLRAHPLCECEECNAPGAIPQVAEVVDHKVPHRGDMALFWDRSNWQAMSKSHHDRKTALEDGGFGRPSVRQVIEAECVRVDEQGASVALLSLESIVGGGPR